MTVQEIADWLGAEYEGDGAVTITEVADVSKAGAGEIAFVHGRKAVPQAGKSNAGCLLVPPDFPRPAGRTAIRVADPRAAFVLVVRRYHPAARPEPGVHATAVVGPGVRIGENVSVGPLTVLGEGTRIGDGTLIGAGCHIGPGVVIGPNGHLHDAVTIYHDVTIGRNCILHSGSVLGADGFGFVLTGDHYEKFPQIGRVELGDDVEIGANSCVDRAALGLTRIGDGTKLDNLIHIAHSVTIGNHVVMASGTGISGGATIGNYVVIAGQVGLGEKANIEDKAILGGQCGVLPSKTVPSGQAVWGTPARPLREHLAQLANLGKVAALRRQVADLEARLEKIEESG